jgi:diaminopimelate epimerase
MKISFSKYHGTGNDFILINNLEERIWLTGEQIVKLCHRKFGIGADGLIFLLPSGVSDFKMKYYNADGGEGTFCGNGARCITAFASKLGIIDTSCEFQALDGKHKGEIIQVLGNETIARVSLQDVTDIQKLNGNYVINTGSPHFVKFVKDINNTDVFNEGKKIRWSKRFQPEGINVNFVGMNENQLVVRTYERGVENITLSCGTGVTASAIAYALATESAKPFYSVSTRGGHLKVSFIRTGNHVTNVELEGPVMFVFDAIIDL